MKTKTTLSFLFSIMILSSVLTVNAQSPFIITVSTPQASYNRGEVVTISGTLLSNGQSTTGLVGIRVVNGQSSVAIRTVSAGTVSNPPGAITQVYLSDSSADPVTSVSSGDLAFFTIRVINNDLTPRDLVAIVTVYDANGVPLSMGGIKHPQVPPDTGFTSTVSLEIPLSAAGGQAYAYGELFSNWPNQGGYPLAPETPLLFTIDAPTHGTGQHSISIGSQGSYSLSFRLPPTATLGQDDIYVISSVNGVSASNLAYFYVKQIGDFNADNRLDFRDLLFFTGNWIAYYNGQIWDPKIDLNNDGKVNFNDLMIFTNAWIIYNSAG